MRELQARVKAARALVVATPGLTEALQHEWQRAARFYSRFGITEPMFRHGAAEGSVSMASYGNQG